jgi:aconitate hydratase
MARADRHRAAKQEGAVTLATARRSSLDHGAVTIAAITPARILEPSVMIGAAQVAKKAVERGAESQALV